MNLLLAQEVVMKEGARAANRNLRRLLELTREMLALADEGDRDRQDDSCAILYGILRDSGYRLRRLAEQERELHRQDGTWE
ncbi:MAG: hypothetical protein DRI34_08540 [Deltaproteobacteria bacterium]|nr:MAG: hypothetical protein DRI34_08540 [Deltaproteobacteria bacterium]